MRRCKNVAKASKCQRVAAVSFFSPSLEPRHSFRSSAGNMFAADARVRDVAIWSFRARDITYGSSRFHRSAENPLFNARTKPDSAFSCFLFENLCDFSFVAFLSLRRFAGFDTFQRTFTRHNVGNNNMSIRGLMILDRSRVRIVPKILEIWK